jgi:hypothetical protein
MQCCSRNAFTLNEFLSVRHYGWKGEYTVGWRNEGIIVMIYIQDIEPRTNRQNPRMSSIIFALPTLDVTSSPSLRQRQRGASCRQYQWAYRHHHHQYQTRSCSVHQSIRIGRCLDHLGTSLANHLGRLDLQSHSDQICWLWEGWKQQQ